MPTNETLGSIAQGVNEAMAPATNTSASGVGGILNTANAMQTLQANQQKQQLLQQQLQNSQWEANKSMLNTYVNASDGVRRAMKKQIGGRLKQNGADPMILDSLDDEDMEQNYRTAMNAFGNDPNAAAQGMATLSHVGAFETNVPSMADMVKQRSQAQVAASLKQSQMQQDAFEKEQDRLNKLELNKQTNLSREKQAEGRFGDNSPQMVRATGQQNAQYQNTMKPYETALQNADQLQTILGDVDANKLNSAKNVRADINSKMASLINAGHQSVHNTEAVELGSAYGDLQDKLNHVLGEANGTITQDQLNQLHQELNSFKGTVDKNHQDAYDSFREGVHPRVQSALDNRFNQFRASKGLPTEDFTKEPGNRQPVSANNISQPAASAQNNAPSIDQTLLDRAKKAGFNVQQALADGKTAKDIDAALTKRNF